MSGCLVFAYTKDKLFRIKQTNSDGEIASTPESEVKQHELVDVMQELLVTWRHHLNQQLKCHQHTHIDRIWLHLEGHDDVKLQNLMK